MVKSGECFNSQNVNYTCWGRDDTKAISLQHWNQSTVKLFNQNLFISIRSCLLSFKWSRLVLKTAGLVSFDCAKFYMNFTKDFLVLCEIIERHEGKRIIVVVNFFIVGLSYSMHQSMDDTVLTVMVCAWTSVKYIITNLDLHSITLFWQLKFWAGFCELLGWKSSIQSGNTGCDVMDDRLMYAAAVVLM